MAEPLDNVAYLAQAIGPRPAGTEEEQQAALFITEQLQQDAGMAAVLEDFNCNPDHDLPRVILVVVTLIAALLAMFVQAMVVPALIVSLLCAILFATESFGKTRLSRLLGSGVSQNVVAKYIPAPSEDAAMPRRRKVILVANYDSGKIRKDLSSGMTGSLSVTRWVALGGMFAIPLIMLVRSLMTFGGTSLIVVNVITGIALVCCLLPAVQFVMARSAAYNEAANCNAAGVAVLMEVAKRIGYAGSYVYRPSVSDFAAQPEVHGEQAAREAGLIPEEAELVYEVEPAPAIADPSLPEDSPEVRLIAAKAAIAALTGKPVSSSVNISFGEPEDATAQDEPLEDAFAEGAEALSEADGVLGEEESFEGASAVEAGESVEPAVEEAAEAIQEASPAVPDWFRRAQEKAKKPAADASPEYRSRFADALDAAARESAERVQAANEEASRAAISETEERIQRIRESIMEVKAPGFSRGYSASKAAAVESEAAPEAGADALTAASDGASSVVPAMPAAAAEALGLAAEAAGAAVSGVAAASGAAAVAAQPAVNPRPAVTLYVPTVEGSSDEEASAVAALSAANAAQKKPSMRQKRAISLPSIGKSQGKEGEAADAAEVQGGSASSGRVGAIRNLKAKLPSVAAGEAAGDAKGADKGSAAAKLAGIPAINAGAEPEVAPAVPAVPVVPAVQSAQAEQAMPEGRGATALLSEAAELGQTRAFLPYDAQEVSALQEQPPAPAADLSFDSFGAAPDDLSATDDAPASPAVAPAASPAPGAPSANRPGYAKMPKSRIQGFLGRFSRNGERRSVREEHSTPQEWLDIDSDFDARAVGAARGGWESFRDEEAADASFDAPVTRYADEIDAAFSDEADDFSRRASSRRNRRWEGGSVTRERLGRVSTLSGDADADEYPLGSPQHEENVYSFRHPGIDVEVWFVALGAELAANGGMEAFLAEHANDLRGAVFIELEGLGAGDLAVVEKEGLYKQVAVPSRMKRYASKASAEFGIPLSRIDLAWRETSSSYVMKNGYQALHLVGALDGKPARYGQQDDVLSNIDEELLMRNADFVMELLKQI